MLILHVTSSRFCWYLPNIHHFTCTFSNAHTDAYTHKHTCTISTHEEWWQPGTGAWLRGAEERLCWRLCTHKKEKRKFQKKLIFPNLKKRFEHIELPAKLLDYFLRSNKSNINPNQLQFELRVFPFFFPRHTNSWEKIRVFQEIVLGFGKFGISKSWGFPRLAESCTPTCRKL